jgi:hypothetical protein
MKDAKAYLTRAKIILDDLHIPYGNIVNVVVNSRAKSRWGRCSKVVGGYKIEISDRLLQDNVSFEATLNTMVHELLHAYEGRMCHTGEWKRCAEIVNRNYDYLNIQRCTSSEEKGIEATSRVVKYKYKVTCQTCGHACYYQRHSAIIKALEKDEHSCRCTCGSDNLKLEVI